MFALALAAAIAASPPSPDPAAAEIARLEQQWGEAFVTRDFGFIDSIVAPGYRLIVARPDGSFEITPRAQWMKTAADFDHQAFAVETVDVNLSGDIAVASARGVWTVARAKGEPARPIRFFVTDTWVRSGGKWQVIHRYSHRLGDQPQPATPASN